jgi:hypothetical protein
MVPWLRWNHRRTEKKKIGRALIERTVSHCRTRRVPVCFLIFYGKVGLTRPTWEDVFLRDTFDALGVCYVDTKPLLRGAVASRRISEDDLFDRETGHHTAVANEVIADELARQWGRIEAAIPE